jgi:hypothetical protein
MTADGAEEARSLLLRDARLDEHVDRRAVAADEAGVPQEQAPRLLGSVGGHRSRTRRISAARAGWA